MHYSNGTVRTYCTLAFLPQSANYVILGAPFMRNYYMIFDLDQDIMGISNLYTTSNMFKGDIPKKQVVVPSKPGKPGKNQGGDTSPDSPALDNFFIYGILLVVILVLTLFIVILLIAIWYFGFNKSASGRQGMLQASCAGIPL